MRLEFIEREANSSQYNEGMEIERKAFDKHTVPRY